MTISRLNRNINMKTTHVPQQQNRGCQPTFHKWRCGNLKIKKQDGCQRHYLNTSIIRKASKESTLQRGMARCLLLSFMHDIKNMKDKRTIMERENNGENNLVLCNAP